MNKRKVSPIFRVQRFFAAATVAFFPSWFGVQAASASLSDDNTPPTTYPLPDPNAPEDCSYVTVEMSGCTTMTMPPTTTSTTTSTTSTTAAPTTTTTTTMPPTTTSTTTSTTSTTMPSTTSTSTTVPPTTTTATPSTTLLTTTTAAPTTLAPTTTAAPVVVTPTTRPQPTLAVTGSSNSKPMAGAALIALAGGLGMVAFAEKQKLKATPATAYTRPLGQATPTKTYRSSSNIVPPISSRSALTLVALERTVNIPVIEVREIAKPFVAVDAAPKMFELEAAPVTVSRDAHRLARAEAELLREFPAPVTIELQDLSSRFGPNVIAL